MKFLTTILAVMLLFQAKTQTILVRVHPSLVDLTITEPSSSHELTFQTVFNENGRLVFQNYLAANPDFSDLGDFKVRRVFTNLSWKDSLTVSRSGETINIPPFWATFALDNVKSTISTKLLSSLQSANTWVDYAEYAPEILQLSTPNDEFFPQQYSLVYNPTIPNANIHAEEAWDIETGRSFVKIGVIDSGIDTLHDDVKALFGGIYNTQPVNGDWGSGIDFHGTAVASIIGAKRNNEKGIAGVAGGDGTEGSGVSLIDLKYDHYSQDVTLLLMATIDASRSVGTYWSWGEYDDSNGDPIPYLETAPGFGVNTLNHSYTIRAEIPTTAVGDGKNETDPIIIDVGTCDLCRETFLFSFRCGVVNVVARGNTNVLEPDVNGNIDSTAEEGYYPQSFNDSWIISVGASGYDGTTIRGNVNQGYWDEINGFASVYGGHMDLIAPGSDSIVRAAKYIDNSSTYDWFNGTSAAAPHVSGTVGLLQSYYNRDCYANQNLTIEDVEYILEHSATDVLDVGYDEISAHGRLNAYESLKMIEYPIKQFVHPTNIVDTSVLSRDTIAMHYEFAYSNLNWGPISSNFLPFTNTYYQVERLKYQAKYDFSNYLTSETTINAIFPLFSKSNALRFIEDTVSHPISGWIYDYLDVHPYVKITDIDTLNGLLTTEGYYYHFIATYSGMNDFEINENFPIDFWYPVNPMISGVKLPVSIYLTDSTLTGSYDASVPCDSLNPPYDTHLGSTSSSEKLLKVFPNPSTDQFMVELPYIGEKQLQVVDLSGKELFSITTSDEKYRLNLNHFAAGTFILHVNTEQGMYVTKLLKL